MSRQPHPSPLVGRLEELERLGRAIEPRGKSAAFIIVEGEPGIGKTRMLSELSAMASDAGFLVLGGRAGEIEADVPFAAAIDALDDHLASINPRSLRPTDEEGRAELSRIFPALSELAVAPAAVQEERYRSYRAVRRMLEGLAATRPLLLTLDDLHWADEATVELISHLLRHPPQASLVVALSHRGGRAPPNLRVAVTEAERDREVERLTLAPLSVEEARLMISPALEPELGLALYEQSGGNPFFIEELVRTGWTPAELSAGSPSPAHSGTPEQIVVAISQELSALSTDAGELLRGASVLGEEFEPEIAASVGAVGATATAVALDQLEAVDLIRAAGTPRRFRFRHPIVHRAVYEEAPSGWRLAAHARAADLLASAGAPATVRAQHVELSAAQGDQDAIGLLIEAGESATARAPAAAAHWFAAALRLIPPGDRDHRLSVLAPLAQAQASCGRYPESLVTIDEILASIPDANPELRARMIFSAGQVKQFLGRHNEARDEMIAALNELPQQQSAEATALRLMLASDSFFAADFERLVSWVKEALDDATARRDERLTAAATGLLAAALYMNDETDEARAALEQATSLIRALPDSSLALDLASYSWTAIAAVCLERFDTAETLLERCIDVALATGKGHLAALMRATQAFAAIWTGRLGEAHELLDAAVEASILVHNPVLLAWGRSLQSWLVLIGGDVPRALQLAESASEAAGDSTDPITATAAAYLAEALVAAGEPERARDDLLARAGGPRLTRIEGGFRSRPYEILCRAELALGNVDEAAGWAARAEEEARGLGIHGRNSDALRARAEIDLARGDNPSAREAAEGAAAAAELARLPVEAARARILVGRAIGGAGRTEDAVALLSAVRIELAGLGAGHYADQAASEIRRLGVRVSRPAPASANGSGLDSLTSREREISALVAAGRRNREIATALYLSVRTVENHLARIYRKLGMSSRTQLARLINEKSPPPP